MIVHWVTRLYVPPDEFPAQFEIEVATWFNQARPTMKQKCHERGAAYEYTFSAFLEGPIWQGTLPPTYRDAAKSGNFPTGCSDKSVAGYVARTRELWRDCIRGVLFQLTGSKVDEVESALELADRATRNPVTCSSIFHAIRGDSRVQSDHVETINTIFRSRLSAVRDMRELLNQRDSMLNTKLKWLAQGREPAGESTVRELLAIPFLRLSALA